MTEYREVKIIYDTSLENELLKVLEDEGIEEYTIFSKLKGAWGKDRKHFDNHVWPGTDCILYFILEKESIKGIIDKYVTLKESMSYFITFKIVVTPVEMYIK